MGEAAGPARLEAMLAELDGLGRGERIELLTDYARRLPPVPERLRADPAAGERVTECLTPVWLYVEAVDGQVRFYVDVPASATALAAVAAVLIEGCEGATPAELAGLSPELPLRILGVGMAGRRRAGLMALVKRLTRRVGEVGNLLDPT